MVHFKNSGTYCSPGGHSFKGCCSNKATKRPARALLPGNWNNATKRLGRPWCDSIVEHTIAGLGLQLSAEKTKVTTYGKCYQFLGFFLSFPSKRMRDKSVRKFKDKVRELTRRHLNLDVFHPKARTIDA
ncbi:MAG: hypothetical protein AB9866_09400 [Syntrophobacteraceae bacterium]